MWFLIRAHPNESFEIEQVRSFGSSVLEAETEPEVARFGRRRFPPLLFLPLSASTDHAPFRSDRSRSLRSLPPCPGCASVMLPGSSSCVDPSKFTRRTSSSYMLECSMPYGGGCAEWRLLDHRHRFFFWSSSPIHNTVGNSRIGFRLDNTDHYISKLSHPELDWKHSTPNGFTWNDTILKDINF